MEGGDRCKMVQSTIQLTIVLGGLRAQHGAGGCRVGLMVGACRQVDGCILVHWLVHPAGCTWVWLGAHSCYKGHT